MSKALSDDKSNKAFVGSHCHAIPRSGHVPRGNDLTLPLTGYSGFRCPPKMHCRYQSTSEIFGSGSSKSLVKTITSLSPWIIPEKANGASHLRAPFLASFSCLLTGSSYLSPAISSRLLLVLLSGLVRKCCFASLGVTTTASTSPCFVILIAVSKGVKVAFP
jgi:hypothetical protein